MTSLLIAVFVTVGLSPEDNPAKDDQQPQTWKLVYKFEEGLPVHYSVEQSTTRQSRQQSATQLVRDKVREQKHLAVADVREDGSFVLRTVFDRVRMEADFGAKKVNFDSDKPASEDPPGFARFRKSIARPQFEVHFAANGKLLAVRRLSSARTSDAKSAGRNNDGSSFLVVFPEKALQVGDTWREEYSVALPLGQGIIQNVEILRTYRLHAVKDGIAELTFASSLKTPIRNPEILAKLVQSTPSGTIRFDLERGQIVERRMKVDKTVLNHSGPGSVLHTISQRVERRVDPGEATTASTR